MKNNMSNIANNYIENKLGKNWMGERSPHILIPKIKESLDSGNESFIKSLVADLKKEDEEVRDFYLELIEIMVAEKDISEKTKSTLFAYPILIDKKYNDSIKGSINKKTLELLSQELSTSSNKFIFYPELLSIEDIENSYSENIKIHDAALKSKRSVIDQEFCSIVQMGSGELNSLSANVQIYFLVGSVIGESRVTAKERGIDDDDCETELIKEIINNHGEFDYIETVLSGDFLYGAIELGYISLSISVINDNVEKHQNNGGDIQNSILFINSDFSENTLSLSIGDRDNPFITEFKVVVPSGICNRDDIGSLYHSVASEIGFEGVAVMSEKHADKLTEDERNRMIALPDMPQNVVLH